MEKMRIKTGGVAILASPIEKDLRDRLSKKVDVRVLANIADCVACALTSRSANTGEWISILPRECAKKSKEFFISRALASPLINQNTIMKAFASEIISLLSRNNKTVVLMMDQSQIKEDKQCLMISVRFEERALPIAWTIKGTKGAIGFEEQEELLNKVLEMIPEGTDILLAADRFYGTKSLVAWCQNARWHYRVRLKGNLIFEHEGGEIKAEEVGNMEGSMVMDACFNGSDISTNIGFLYEGKKYKEPWIIAMDCKPSKYKVLDYSMRWGIECMFSDFKSRGFSVTDTHFKREDRMENLILILTIALYWAVSVGTMPQNSTENNFSKKNSADQSFLPSREAYDLS